MPLLRIFAILAAAALSGCASTSNSDLRITDRGTFIPSGRLSVDIAPRGASVPQGPSVPHTGHGIEMGITGASGDDSQTLSAGALPAVFAGRTFTVGDTLRHEFDWRFAEIAYRYRHFFGGGTFGIEAIGGLAYAEFDLTVASATQRASEKLGSGGLVGGFGIIWKFLPTTSLQSRITLFGSGETEDVTAASRLDVYVAQALGRHAAVRAGFSGWGLISEREANDAFGSINSRIRARFSGVALGLDLMF